ncbi:hypothetical protein IU500_28115 [Nocardia terpenica]|uniref:RICIN domain-containing protein n=1 Tax=Nocardia terpenica TaxID=455432 RepID=UPI00189307FF|nr:hypothetical protein [Nocardia terpenica]MBF6065151.1 hypothetical protein [Nocardia terpenica]MBF6107879.1 hypothetical protein [Nocardia terpenica]MBF6115590.1 hypothetical protein [Nocardia terpenica]MBF6122027.1 hypothetical protein [Nocardia terpenica]MBF6155429.1 hypothetical protein [Nocardia terpenica]
MRRSVGRPVFVVGSICLAAGLPTGTASADWPDTGTGFTIESVAYPGKCLSTDRDAPQVDVKPCAPRSNSAIWQAIDGTGPSRLQTPKGKQSKGCLLPGQYYYVYLSSCKNPARWEYVPGQGADGTGQIRIDDHGTPRCLRVIHKSETHGGNVFQAPPCDPAARDQQWRVTPVSN